jgi:hypothetical protein
MWAYEHLYRTVVKPNNGKNLVCCKSAILVISFSNVMPSVCIILKTVCNDFD